MPSPCQLKALMNFFHLKTSKQLLAPGKFLLLCKLDNFHPIEEWKFSVFSGVKQELQIVPVLFLLLQI